ncbi:60S acidic ribosomal protein P2-like [Malaclemys terrapin pileata]|uniref:60S acidic ribosomal protein P2-like n=1 Tax=Malaclemys terrapin pileata TaxID=2991368 RepID=UPI0023A911B9|nr:60S acidic ribosomal protein P2-like [Malaclemys terrapin pileata]
MSCWFQSSLKWIPHLAQSTAPNADDDWSGVPATVYPEELDNAWTPEVVGELNGNNIEDVIAQGNCKLASMPVGGAVAVSAGPGSAAPAAAEEKEESDNDMECGLFD